MEMKCGILLWKGSIFQIFLTSFGLGPYIWKNVWTVVGLGLSFEKSGLDLDRKIWQSAHLFLPTLKWVNSQRKFNLFLLTVFSFICQTNRLVFLINRSKRFRPRWEIRLSLASCWSTSGVLFSNPENYSPTLLEYTKLMQILGRLRDKPYGKISYWKNQP